MKPPAPMDAPVCTESQPMEIVVSVSATNITPCEHCHTFPFLENLQIALFAGVTWTAQISAYIESHASISRFEVYPHWQGRILKNNCILWLFLASLSCTSQRQAGAVQMTGPDRLMCRVAVSPLRNAAINLPSEAPLHKTAKS